MDGTMCATCHRAIRPEHTDEDGNCVFCSVRKPPTTSTAGLGVYAEKADEAPAEDAKHDPKAKER